MTVEQSCTGLVGIDYSQFWLGDGPIEEFDGPMAAEMIYQVAGRNGVFVATAREYGKVRVTLRTYSERPVEPGPEWTNAVLATIQTTAPTLSAQSVLGDDDGDDVRLDLVQPGVYGLCIAAKGREEEDEWDTDTPIEEYLVEIWPTTALSEPTPVPRLS